MTGSVYWRPEGKAKFDAINTVVFGPSRWMYFDMGTITGLAVSGTHQKDSTDALYPTLTPLPVFSWTDNTKGMSLFYMDISTSTEPRLSDKKQTIILGGAGIKGQNSYTLTTNDWKKIRKLARSASGGLLHWRVRASDADKALDCGSGIKDLVIDSGNWTVGDLDLTAISPSLSWSTDAEGITGYQVEFSVNDQFAAGARSTLKVPTKAIAATSYNFTAAEVTKLATFAARSGVASLYYRVRGQDADGCFSGVSGAKTTAVPAL